MGNPSRNPLTVRVCELLRNAGPKTVTEVAYVLECTNDSARTALNGLVFTRCVTSDKKRPATYTFVRMPSPPSLINGKSEKPRREFAGSGVVAGIRPPPDPRKVLQRDPYALWRLCERDPVETSRSAVFHITR